MAFRFRKPGQVVLIFRLIRRSFSEGGALLQPGTVFDQR